MSGAHQFIYRPSAKHDLASNGLPRLAIDSLATQRRPPALEGADVFRNVRSVLDEYTLLELSFSIVDKKDVQSVSQTTVDTEFGRRAL